MVTAQDILFLRNSRVSLRSFLTSPQKYQDDSLIYLRNANNRISVMRVGATPLYCVTVTTIMRHLESAQYWPKVQMLKTCTFPLLKRPTYSILVKCLLKLKLVMRYNRYPWTDIILRILAIRTKRKLHCKLPVTRCSGMEHGELRCIVALPWLNPSSSIWPWKAVVLAGWCDSHDCQSQAAARWGLWIAAWSDWTSASQGCSQWDRGYPPQRWKAARPSFSADSLLGHCSSWHLASWPLCNCQNIRHWRTWWGLGLRSNGL